MAAKTPAIFVDNNVVWVGLCLFIKCDVPRNDNDDEVITVILRLPARTSWFADRPIIDISMEGFIISY